jgi:hypothetical protein
VQDNDGNGELEQRRHCDKIHIIILMPTPLRSDLLRDGSLCTMGKKRPQGVNKSFGYLRRKGLAVPVGGGRSGFHRFAKDTDGAKQKGGSQHTIS